MRRVAVAWHKHERINLVYAYAVARHKYELKVAARGLDRLVRLGELGREALARRAPVRAKVEAHVLVLERRGARELGALAVEQHLAKQLVKRLGRPRKVGALRVAHDDAAAVLGEHLACRAVDKERATESRSP